MSEARQKMVERIEAELNYGILIADLDVRQLKLESIKDGLTNKQVDEYEKLISQKEREKEHLEKRLSLLGFYKPTGSDV